MELFKENKRNTFNVKKFHQRIEKENRSQALEESRYACFKDMTPQNLLHFMENKYDFVSSKNSENIVQLNQAILQRVSDIKDEFHAEHKKKFIDFLIKGGKKISDEEYENFINRTKYVLPKDCRAINKHYGDIQTLQVIIHQNDRNLREEKSFYCSKLPSEWSSDISFKRVKKDTIYFLENFITLCNKIE